jgi:hypothetical protein
MIPGATEALFLPCNRQQISVRWVLLRSERDSVGATFRLRRSVTPILLVPPLCGGMHIGTLRVPTSSRRRASRTAFPRRAWEREKSRKLKLADTGSSANSVAAPFSTGLILKEVFSIFRPSPVRMGAAEIDGPYPATFHDLSISGSVCRSTRGRVLVACRCFSFSNFPWLRIRSGGLLLRVPHEISISPGVPCPLPRR